MKTYPRLANKMLALHPDLPGKDLKEKLYNVNTMLGKVATAKQDNVNPDDEVLVHLRGLIKKFYKERHFKQEDANQLFSVFMTLFGGRIPTFAKFLSENLPKKDGFVKLSDKHDLRMAGFNIDLKEDQLGRFPVINATLNWGSLQYKGKLIWTPSIREDVGRIKDNGVVGSAELVIWSNQPHGYRYLEKKGLTTNFTITSRKRVEILH